MPISKPKSDQPLWSVIRPNVAKCSVSQCKSGQILHIQSLVKSGKHYWARAGSLSVSRCQNTAEWATISPIALATWDRVWNKPCYMKLWCIIHPTVLSVSIYTFWTHRNTKQPITPWQCLLHHLHFLQKICKVISYFHNAIWYLWCVN